MKHEANHAGQLSAALRHRPRHLERDRHVHVVAAGVHHAPTGRAERQLTCLLDGQAVDIRAHQHPPPGSRAFQIGDDSGFGNARLQPVRRKRFETLGDIARRLEFFEG